MAAPGAVVELQYCEAHLERRGVQVPAVKLGLCLDCFQGRPLPPRRRRRELTPADRQAQADYLRAWKAAHPERGREYARRWRANHREQSRAGGRRRAKERPELARARNRRWHERHREKNLARMRRYRERRQRPLTEA